MTIHTIALRGVVHGKTIELDEETGLPDGLEVTVSVQHAGANRDTEVQGDGLRRAFGDWAEDSEDLDEYLAWNRQQRKNSRPEIEP